jgi:hypothetical protein
MFYSCPVDEVQQRSRNILSGVFRFKSMKSYQRDFECKFTVLDGDPMCRQSKK